MKDFYTFRNVSGVQILLSKLLILYAICKIIHNPPRRCTRSLSFMDPC